MNKLILSQLKLAQSQHQKTLTDDLMGNNASEWDSQQLINNQQNVEQVVMARLTGRVVKCFRDRNSKFTGRFKVYTERMKQELDCYYGGFFPIKEGDVVEGICRVTTNIKNEQQLIFDRPPLVQIAMDRDSIMSCMISVLRGTGFGSAKAFNLYDRFFDEVKDKDKVTGYISELAAQWHDTKNEEMLSPYSSVINPKILSRFLSWWYKNQNLRRLYLFGLTNHDIRTIGLALDTIYDKCMTNPYTLIPLSIEKCDEIFARRNITPTDEDKRCAIIVRKIYDNMENKGWTGTPSKILTSNFPDLPSYMDKLKKEYNVVGEMFTIYLEYPYKVEVDTASTIEKMINRNRESKRSEDASFIRTTLTNDQKEAIQGALDNEISIVMGGAGTGKTTIISEIIHNLEIRNVPYMVASFTGKAVSRIREVIKRKTPSTLHRLIARSSLVPKFKHLIIDEASMVTTSLFYEFKKKFGLDYKITFVGDPNQLEPIGYGSLFEQMILSKLIPTYSLKHVHRTALSESNGILLNACKIIEYAQGDDTLPPFEFDLTDNFSVIDGDIESVYEVIKALNRANVSSENATVVSPYNKDVIDINKVYQQIYNDENRSIVDPKGNLWMLKDRVSLKINRYDINIMNGEEGIVTDISNDAVLVTFKDGVQHAFKLKSSKDKDVKVNANGDLDGVDIDDDDETTELTVNLLRHSFALTVHLAQGSEWDYVIIYIPQSPANNRFLNRKLVYTAISRAKKAVWCIGDLVALNLAVVRPSAYRCDNLSKRLAGDGIQISFSY